MGPATATSPAKVLEITRHIPNAGIRKVICRLLCHDIALFTAPSWPFNAFHVEKRAAVHVTFATLAPAQISLAYQALQLPISCGSDLSSAGKRRRIGISTGAANAKARQSPDQQTYRKFQYRNFHNHVTAAAFDKTKLPGSQ